jgi:hypothetical protein
MDNKKTTLNCSPRYIENFEPVNDAERTRLGWYQVAGKVSGTGGPGDSNVFTTDSNWAYNNVRIPSNYKDIDAFQLLIVTNEGNFNKVAKIEPDGSGLKITLEMNTNLAGQDVTFWFKNILKDDMGGNSEAEHKAVGSK